MNLKDEAQSRTALFWFRRDQLLVKPGLNARDLATPENARHVEDIAALIEAEGFLQSKPLEIFTEGDLIYVSDGHVRLAAIDLLAARGIAVEKIPCVPEARGTNDADRILKQSLHNSGKRLTPLEEGHNIKRVMAMAGISVSEVARRLGKSTTYVANALDFQAAPAEVHALVKEGAVSASFAAETIRKEGAAKGVATIKQAVEVAKEAGVPRASAKHVAKATEASVPTASVTAIKRGETFQDGVASWMLACFGAQIAADGVERNHRFLEEALELVQSLGCTHEEALRLVAYVYSRPIGEPAQEVGGVMVTLAALCSAHGLDMVAAGGAELERVWTKIEQIRAKQAAKPKHSPLPQALTEGVFRAGDIVRHRPTCEEWTVAYVDGEHLASCGWPDGEVRVADCDLVAKCTDQKHLEMLRQIAASGGKRAQRASAALAAMVPEDRSDV